MIQLKISQHIQILNLNAYFAHTTDTILFSRRSKGILRISRELLSDLLNKEFMSLPEALIVLLLQYEMLVAAAEDELISLSARNNALENDGVLCPVSLERIYADSELLDYSRTMGLIKPL